MNAVLDQCAEGSYPALFLDGEGDVQEICRLSCMERGVRVLEKPDGSLPVVKIAGLKLFYMDPEEEK